MGELGLFSRGARSLPNVRALRTRQAPGLSRGADILSEQRVTRDSFQAFTVWKLI